LPNLALPTEENKPIGIWGQRHLRYLREYRRIIQANLITNGKLNSYLADIDKQAEDMLFQLVEQMAERDGLTEQLKAESQMKWVGVTGFGTEQTEIVKSEWIFA
jgi:hypothetical protein